MNRQAIPPHEEVFIELTMNAGEQIHYATHIQSTYAPLEIDPTSQFLQIYGALGVEVHFRGLMDAFVPHTDPSNRHMCALDHLSPNISYQLPWCPVVIPKPQIKSARGHAHTAKLQQFIDKQPAHKLFLPPSTNSTQKRFVALYRASYNVFKYEIAPDHLPSVMNTPQLLEGLAYDFARTVCFGSIQKFRDVSQRLILEHTSSLSPLDLVRLMSKEYGIPLATAALYASRAFPGQINASKYRALLVQEPDSEQWIVAQAPKLLETSMQVSDRIEAFIVEEINHYANNPGEYTPMSQQKADIVSICRPGSAFVDADSYKYLQMKLVVIEELGKPHATRRAY